MTATLPLDAAASPRPLLRPAAPWLRARGGSLIHRTWLIRAVLMPSVVAAVILRGLAAPGYLLQVDASYGPERPWPPPGFNSATDLVQTLLQHAVGGAITGRLFVSGAVFLCGFGPMLLLRRRPWAVQCAAGLLGMLNPWVYDRLADGQWNVLVSAGLLAAWVASWESLQARPQLRRAVVVAACGAVVVYASDTFLPIMLVLLAGGVIGSKPWRDRLRLKWTAAATVGLLLLLAYGLVPFLNGSNPRSHLLLEHVGAADWQTFASVTSPQYGLFVNLLGLHGYWAEPLGRFPPVGSSIIWWPVSAAFLIGLALLGAWRTATRRWLLIVGVAGLAVSATTAVPGGLSFAIWLSSHVHILSAIREPQKFLSLWLLALVVLGAEGAVAFFDRGRPRLMQGAAFLMAAAALLPVGLQQLALAPAVVTPVQYPHSWFATAAYLHAYVPDRTPVLVLPWHAYAAFPFTGNRLVRNPAPVFFPGNLITSNDLELPQEQSFERGSIGEAARWERDPDCVLAKRLEAARIRWVIVENEPDGPPSAERLMRCGFRVAQGGSGGTMVLRTEYS